MPSPNVILDSCSYFRLAQSIRPLLKNEFGKEKYCLGVIKELEEEYEKNPTLKHKFFWVNQNERFAFELNLRHSISPFLRSIPCLQEIRANDRAKRLSFEDDL